MDADADEGADADDDDDESIVSPLRVGDTNILKFINYDRDFTNISC